MPKEVRQANDIERAVVMITSQRTSCKLIHRIVFVLGAAATLASAGDPIVREHSEDQALLNKKHEDFVRRIRSAKGVIFCHTVGIDAATLGEFGFGPVPPPADNGYWSLPLKIPYPMRMARGPDLEAYASLLEAGEIFPGMPPGAGIMCQQLYLDERGDVVVSASIEYGGVVLLPGEYFERTRSGLYMFRRQESDDYIDSLLYVLSDPFVEKVYSQMQAEMPCILARMEQDSWVGIGKTLKERFLSRERR